jgi:hypothetical protein
MPLTTHPTVLTFGELMERFELFFAGVYDDATQEHLPSIGIGVNLEVRDYLALCLRELGVFTASDQLVAASQQPGQPAETQAQRDIRYQDIITGFYTLVMNPNPPLNRTGGNPGSTNPEQQLQTALNDHLQNTRHT